VRWRPLWRRVRHWGIPGVGVVVCCRLVESIHHWIMSSVSGEPHDEGDALADQGLRARTMSSGSSSEPASQAFVPRPQERDRDVGSQATAGDRQEPRPDGDVPHAMHPCAVGEEFAPVSLSTHPGANPAALTGGVVPRCGRGCGRAALAEARTWRPDVSNSPRRCPLAPAAPATLAELGRTDCVRPPARCRPAPVTGFVNLRRNGRRSRPGPLRRRTGAGTPGSTHLKKLEHRELQQ